MFESNMYVLDESKASAWERRDVLDEETGEPTGEQYETRSVPAASNGGGHQHFGFQTRSVGAPRTLEDWRLQQSDKADKPASSPWFEFTTVDDDGIENGKVAQRLVLTDAGGYATETRHTTREA